MKIINKQNFFSCVCIVFTMLVLGKIVLEYMTQHVFGNYQENLLVMFVMALLAVFVLSQHYRFQKYPLLAVIAGQYVLLIGIVMLIIWIAGFFQPIHEDGYRDMFVSFTIPYAIGVIVYYAALFHEVKLMNESLKKIKEIQEDPNENKKHDDGKEDN